MSASRRRFIAAAVFAGLLFSSIQCRRATGVDTDPMDAEAEELLLHYIRIDTSNPPGNETAGAIFLQKLLVKEGIDAKLIGPDPKRQSVYARLSSGSKEKPLLLLHHIDVVPVLASEWTQPPFAGIRSNGYLWGRGALDIKSLGIAELMAVIELKRLRLPLKRDVIFLAVADEELGGELGCKALLEQYPELLGDVGYVLNEGGYNETIVDRVAFWGIEVQQKIPLWLRLTAKGTPGHGASPPDDGGSVARLVRALDAVQKIETPYRLTESVARYFHQAGKSRKDDRGALLRSIAEPLDPDRLKRVLSPGYRSLLRDTIAITRVQAGTTVNSIPAVATADIDIRLLPDANPDEMIATVRAATAGNAEVEILLRGGAVPETTADTELFRLLSARMKASEPGSIVGAVVGGGTSDSRFFRQRGVVAYGIAPFKVNYYDADGVHASDERIRARFFAEGVRLTRRIVREFCASKP